MGFRGHNLGEYRKILAILKGKLEGVSVLDKLYNNTMYKYMSIVH